MEINHNIKAKGKDMIKENIIIGYFEIKKNNCKERIINSYENVKREESKWKWDKIESIKNEEEIKDCEIYVNENKINVNYYYYFKKEGKYKIKFVFKKLLKSMNFMFYKCNTLISLDLSNFNGENVTNMGYMLCHCDSLISLDLSNFDSKNLTNI